MSNDLLNSVLGALGPDAVQEVANQLGTNPQQAQGAIQAALPLLLGALGKNASEPEGAQALHTALANDHTGLDIGSVLGAVLGGSQSQSDGGGLGDILGAVMGSGQSQSGGGLGDILGAVMGGGNSSTPQNAGESILRHIFGGQQQRATQGLGQTTGLGGQGAKQLLAILAPIVMQILAKKMQSNNWSPAQLGGALGQQRQQVAQEGGLAGGLMNAVLDKDGDGDVDFSDLLSLGAGFMKK
ncbi:MAG: DUF937 domain-containing protein [Arenimonas sp.]